MPLRRRLSTSPLMSASLSNEFRNVAPVKSTRSNRAPRRYTNSKPAPVRSTHSKWAPARLRWENSSLISATVQMKGDAPRGSDPAWPTSLRDEDDLPVPRERTREFTRGGPALPTRESRPRSQQGAEGEPRPFRQRPRPRPPRQRSRGRPP